MPAFADHPDCDFAGRPETCHALRTGCRRYCELIRAGRDDYRALVRRLTLGEPEPARPVGPPVDLQLLRERAEAETCQRLINCLCGPTARCERDDTPTDWNRCLDCVRSGEHSPRGDER